MIHKRKQNPVKSKQMPKEGHSIDQSKELYEQLLKRCRNQLMIVSNTLSDDKIELVNEIDKILGKNIQRFP